jgi:hypothetical protein
MKENVLGNLYTSVAKAIQRKCRDIIAERSLINPY